MYDTLKNLYKCIFICYLVFLDTSFVKNPEIYLAALSLQAYSPGPSGLVDVQDYVPGILLDMRYATTNNFTGKILDGYRASRAFLLPRVAQALSEAQKELEPKGLALKIYDAYRPLRAEYQMLEWARENKRDDLLFAGYLNANIRPWHTRGHPCGNCIDLTMVDAHGREIDMGTLFDTFTDKSMTLAASGKVLENRLLLKNLMQKYGFRNFYREWWHYTYWYATGPVLDAVIE